MEGDVEVIIKTIAAREFSNPEYGQVIQDVLMLAAGFQFCNFSHVKRIGNTVAYFLARIAVFGNELQV